MIRNDLQGATNDPPARGCPACGVAARRRDARFCRACGGVLKADYAPAESLRASYPAHQRRAVFAPSARNAKNNNGPSRVALAFVAYSLIPCLGILFCVPAVVMGGYGLARWRRAPLVGGRNASLISIVLGFVTLGGQIFLWWIIYRIPMEFVLDF